MLVCYIAQTGDPVCISDVIGSKIDSLDPKCLRARSAFMRGNKDALQGIIENSLIHYSHEEF